MRTARAYPALTAVERIGIRPAVRSMERESAAEMTQFWISPDHREVRLESQTISKDEAILLAYELLDILDSPGVARIQWTVADDEELRVRYRDRQPVPIISAMMERSQRDVTKRINDLGIAKPDLSVRMKRRLA